MYKTDFDKITPAFALKIAGVSAVVEGQCTLTLEGGQEVSDPLVVSEEYVKKYDPQPGGYYIMCENGLGLYSN